ncbi:hypothetical protein A9973_07470 [Achromobacter sp. UMC46]|nr:hypothetical protein [Achromobacter sp. UMC46]
MPGRPMPGRPMPGRPMPAMMRFEAHTPWLVSGSLMMMLGLGMGLAAVPLGIVAHGIPPSGIKPR